MFLKKEKEKKYTLYMSFFFHWGGDNQGKGLF